MTTSATEEEEAEELERMKKDLIGNYDPPSDGDGNGVNGSSNRTLKEVVNKTLYIDFSDKEEDQKLAREVNLTTDDINFVINTIKKEAQYDELSIKQLFYGMSSAFTKVPIPHIINSKESGAGKNYLLELVSKYFPDKYVIPLNGMSNKALFHRKGALVIKNPLTGQEESITPILNELNSQVDKLQEQIEDEKDKDKDSRDKEMIRQNRKRIREIESEIKDIESRAEKLIQLDNQIILCLDTPQDSIYDALMSIISQDTPKDQQYSFVEKSGSGKLGTKDNILRGTPALFSTQVIDDTKTLRFAEKNRRFINVNPDTSNEKIGAANNIIGFRGGYLPEEYDELVVSRHDKERSKIILEILIAKLKQHSKHLEPKEYGVKIPFVLSIMQSMPRNNVWSMTVSNRTIKYLAMIAKVNMDFRPKLVNEQTGQFYPIATFEDLKETLNLMKVGASGVRPYLVTWYNKVFVPAIEDLGGEPNKDVKLNEETGHSVVTAKEKYVGVTTEQLAAKTKEVFRGAKPSSKELRDKYLYPLINQGIIDQVPSELDKRGNIYLPVEEGNLFSMFGDSASATANNNNLKLKVPNPDIFPDKNFLKEQFRISLEKNADEGVFLEKNFCCYKLVDTDGTEITLDQLLDRYFSNPENCFVKAYEEEASNNNKECNCSTVETMLNAAATSNILYQQQIIQKQKNNFIFLPPAVRSILSEIPNNDTEEYYYYSCYYCNSFKTNIKGGYESHIINKHGLGHPCYPCKLDLERLGLKAQGKDWEI